MELAIVNILTWGQLDTSVKTSTSLILRQMSVSFLKLVWKTLAMVMDNATSTRKLVVLNVSEILDSQMTKMVSTALNA